jgi:hypothetical protein
MIYFDKIKSKILISISRIINIDCSKNYYTDREYYIVDLEEMIKSAKLKGDEKIKLK